jgi:hypothetical protein
LRHQPDRPWKDGCFGYLSDMRVVPALAAKEAIGSRRSSSTAFLLVSIPNAFAKRKYPEEKAAE